MCISTVISKNNELCKPLKNRDKPDTSFQFDGFLWQLLANSPEIKKIESIVDNHFWTIHGGQNPIEQLEKLFLNFIKINSSFLLKKSSQEKAEDVFKYYREAYFITLKKDQNFQRLLEKQKCEFSNYFPPSEIENIIREIVLRRIKSFHSSVPGLALEKVLALPSYSLKLHQFPDQSSDTNNMSIANLLSFYQKLYVKS